MPTVSEFPSVTSLIRFDHAHVVALFHRFKRGTSPLRKQAIVANACLALEIHAQVEEEIFYPAIWGSPDMEGGLDTSISDHDEMRRLIVVLRSLEVGHPSFDSTF